VAVAAGRVGGVADAVVRAVGVAVQAAVAVVRAADVVVRAAVVAVQVAVVARAVPEAAVAATADQDVMGAVDVVGRQVMSVKAPIWWRTSSRSTASRRS